MNNHHDNTSTATPKAGEASCKTMRQVKPNAKATDARCRVVRVYIDGWRIGVAGPAGRKFTSVVVMDSSGLSVTRFQKTEAAKAIQSLDYPLAKAVKKMREAGRLFGITKGAKSLLATCATVH